MALVKQEWMVNKSQVKFIGQEGKVITVYGIFIYEQYLYHPMCNIEYGLNLNHDVTILEYMNAMWNG